MLQSIVRVTHLFPSIWRFPLTFMNNRLPTLSQITPPLTSSLSQSRNYKVAVSLQKRCKDCYFFRKGGRLYMDCRTHGRHKTMQKIGKKKYQLYFSDKPFWS